MYCLNCNQENADDAKFCFKCGTSLKQENTRMEDESVHRIDNSDFTTGNNQEQNQFYRNYQYQNQYYNKASTQYKGPNGYQGPVYEQPYVQNPPYANSYYSHEYEPIGMWGYFGYNILFSIPIIGFIIMCVFAFGGSSNINVRNYARSFFCYLIVLTIIIFLILLLVSGTINSTNQNVF